MSLLYEDPKFLGQTIARLLIGVTLGRRWRVQELIGIGGMSVVLKATDGPEGAPVVAKVLVPQLASEQWVAFVKASRREARALRRLSECVPPSPYIVRFFDEGEMEVELPYEFQKRDRSNVIPVRYVILEYVDGRPYGTTLHERIHASLSETQYGFSPTRARRILRHIARALYEIHAERLVHRDLKPSNVLMTGSLHEEVAKVTDFGIVCLQDESNYTIEAISAGYSAPEQYLSASKSPVGPHTDLFSFGVLAYEVLTGCALFPQEPELALAAAYRSHRFSLRAASTLHPEYANAEPAIQKVDSILRWATQSSVYDRPKDIRTLWHALDPVLALVQQRAATHPHRAQASTLLHVPTVKVQHENTFLNVHWRTRKSHPPLPNFAIEHVVCDDEGQAIAIGPCGILFWNGLDWQSIPPPYGLHANAFTCVTHLGEQRYAFGGSKGLLAFLEDHEWTVVPPIDTRVSMASLASHSEGFFAIAGNYLTQAPIVWCAYHEQWLAPLTLSGYESVHELLFLNPYHILVVGTSPQQEGLVTTLRIENNTLQLIQTASLPEPMYTAVFSVANHQAWVTGQSGIMTQLFLNWNYTFSIGQTTKPKPSVTGNLQSIGEIIDIAMGYDAYVWSLWNDGVWVYAEDDWKCIWKCESNDFAGIQLRCVREKMFVFFHCGDVLEASINFTDE